jgi:hypothetical protein
MKVVYLAISQMAKNRTMPIQNWRLALNRFIIEFSEQVEKRGCKRICVNAHGLLSLK